MKNTKLSLSRDIIVATQIYEDTKIKKQPAYTSKIADEVKLTKKEVESSIIKLWYDYHVLDSSFKSVDGYQVLCFELKDDFAGFIRGIYNVTKGENKETEFVDTVDMLPSKH